MVRYRTFIFLIFLCFAFPVRSGTDVRLEWMYCNESVIIGRVSSIADHSVWTRMLQSYVTKEGLVRYARWKKDRKALTEYLVHLAQHRPGATAHRNEQLAYWINLYNAATIQLVLEHYPVKSIRDIAGGAPWDVKCIRVGSEQLSLNDIEHSILRRRFSEPRIHFALNCAARSCPPLQRGAFIADSLDSQLERITRQFIKSKENTIRPTTVYISPLFDWYASDFGDIRAFLRRYTGINIPGSVKIRYRAYDWSLNEEKG